MEAAKHVKIQGRPLDVGGSGKPSYQEVLQHWDKATCCVLDINLGDSVSAGAETSMKQGILRMLRSRTVVFFLPVLISLPHGALRVAHPRGGLCASRGPYGEL
jgi:hypothetical protein